MTTPAVARFLETVRLRDEEARRIMAEKGCTPAELPRPGTMKTVLAEVGEIARTITGHSAIELEPSISEDSIILVGRDRTGRVRIKVQLAKEDVTAEWVPWLTRWLERKSRSTIRLI